MIDEGIKIARHVAIPGLKSGALVGGQWSAGERFPKAPNYARIAREEGFDPKSVSAIWMREEKQVGWFVFEGKPQRGVPLAWFVAQRMSQGRLPWRGIFNLGDVWWFITCDEKGAIHPSFDVAVLPEDKDAFEGAHLSALASFTHGVYCGTPEESWAWLLEDAPVSQAPQMVPVLAAAKARRVAIVGAASLVGLVVAGQLGIHLWRKHEQTLQEQSQEQARILAQRRLREQMTAAVAANGALSKRVDRVWAQTPRPWMSAPAWADVLGAATKAMSTTSVNGWRLAKVVCTVQGASLLIDREWLRSDLATVASAPQGDVAADGNSVTDHEVVKLAAAEKRPLVTLASQQDASRAVMAQSQRYARVYLVRLGAFTPYRPPVPAFVPKDMVSKFNPPVLWFSAPIKIDALMGVAPDLRNAALFGAANVPAKVEIDFMSHSMSWKLEGIEYAQA
jgi:hypothetical protein